MLYFCKLLKFNECRFNLRVKGGFVSHFNTDLRPFKAYRIANPHPNE